MLKENNHKINMLLTQKIKLQTLFFEEKMEFVNINTQNDYLTFKK